MDLKFFYDNYKYDEFTVNKIYIKDNKLYLDIILNAHLELIANGYRPEMDVDYDNIFIFDINHQDKKYKKDDLLDIKYDGNLIIILKNEELVIENDKVEVGVK